MVLLRSFHTDGMQASATLLAVGLRIIAPKATNWSVEETSFVKVTGRGLRKSYQLVFVSRFHINFDSFHHSVVNVFDLCVVTSLIAALLFICHHLESSDPTPSSRPKDCVFH